jgi:hypothetical protein
MDWVCLSPKKQKPPLDIYFQIANEVKVVIFEEDDFLWAETCANNPKSLRNYFCNPNGVE